MVPTTAGTGSEATPNAIVAVPEKELKVGIVNENMIADYVVLDAVMIKKLPRKIAAATGIDALAHAVECYTSNKANPLSDAFSLPALKMILNNIEPACDERGRDGAKADNAACELLCGHRYHRLRHYCCARAELSAWWKISHRARGCLTRFCLCPSCASTSRMKHSAHGLLRAY